MNIKMEVGAMRRRKIAFITSNPNSIFAQRLLKGVFSQSRVYGFDVLVFTSMVQVCHFLKNYLVGELNIYELIRSPEIDGIIVDTVSLTEDHIETVRDKLLDIVKDIPDKPIVSIDMSFGDHEIALTNDTAAFEQITRHIIGTHGCKDICFLAGPKDEDVSFNRLEGFRSAMRNCGLTVNEDRIFYGIFWYSFGEEIAEKVANGEIALPEAFICSTDYIAIGLVNRLAKHGIRVPEDVLVTGYDASAEAAFNAPTITTFIPLTSHTAADAVNIIAQKIAPESGKRPVALSSGENLITCRSCGCKDNKDDIINQFDLSLMMKNPNFGEERVKNEITLNRLLSSYMSEQINSAETPDRCLENISHQIYLLRPYERFCICLREDWGDHESLLENGYPERMKLVFDTKEDSIVCSDTSGVFFDTDKLLPYLDGGDDEPMVYYFTPVHYIQNALGYAVLKRRLTEKKGLDEVFSLWLRNIETGLEMIRVRNKLMSFSEKDALTGLFNRRGMDRWIKEKLRTDEGSAVTVYIIDLDGLKFVNDNFGHKEGDIAIRTIGAALQSVESDAEIAARIGGDEFCMISVCGVPADEKQQKIAQMIEKANALADKPYPISASIGHASGKLLPDTLDALISKADEDMYCNKKLKKQHRS
ncbi:MULTISPECIES: GGDEF domain-containing protein [unclassified Ruminococcus]|uniref:diguanylate cyclase domain-containing protein n=1 Tax=unclassified Ruminococcus TaxID=2608920 RepID=UPI0009FF9623|nr:MULTISPECIES: GGDEF domain-containing protein [unclassified Ruminococcus]